MRSTRLTALGLFCCLCLPVTACTTEEPLEPLPPVAESASTSAETPPANPAPEDSGDGADPAGPGTTAALPDVVCMDLQAAQDAMQAAGYYNLGSDDATGQGRQQLVDRNWVVVGQSPAAGARPEQLAPIQLSAVKFGEPTGASGCES
ncbi:MAG: PASTA domain-containing protein [Actinophytocola sp.]|uniref:PASTA domain-containing protein n=1 Tax=Actinophytocola sp. TaxID=1872138 RepID=UPI003D6C65C2